MFGNIKLRLRRLWKGKETIIHRSSLSDGTVIIPSSGGLKKALRDANKRFWKSTWGILKWFILSSLLVILGLVITHFWNLLVVK